MTSLLYHVTRLDHNNDTSLPKALSDAKKTIIICTSAVPKLRKTSLVKELIKIPIDVISRKKSFQFRVAHFQYPEKVDYLGELAQIDLTKILGVLHIIFVR